MAEAPKVNNYSDSLRQKIADKKAQLPSIVIFRSLGMGRFPFKDEEGNTKMLEQPVSAALSGKSVITEIDPDTKRQRKVTVGVTTAFDSNRNDYSYGFKLIDGLSDAGLLNLRQGVDDEWIDYLLVAPYVKGNLTTDPNTPKAIELVDVEASAKEKLQVRNQKLEAMKAISNMKDSDVRSFVSSINGDETRSIEILRNEVMDMAEKDSAGFSAIWSDPTLKVKSTIRRAIDRGVITFNPDDNSITLAESQTKLVSLHMIEGKSIVDRFAIYYSTVPKGQDVFNSIERALKADLGGGEDLTEPIGKKGAK